MTSEVRRARPGIRVSEPDAQGHGMYRIQGVYVHESDGETV